VPNRYSNGIIYSRIYRIGIGCCLRTDCRRALLPIFKGESLIVGGQTVRVMVTKYDPASVEVGKMKVSLTFGTL